MKKSIINILFFSILVACFSCSNKKYTEVQVPLPRAQEKLAIGDPDDIRAEKGTFNVQKLGYSYDALIPFIDPSTMEIHYAKHYLAYTNALNKVIAGTEFEQLPIETILSKLDITNADLRNNAGGYYNHTVFWESLGPKSGSIAKDTLASSINTDFGSFDIFKKQFSEVANKQFGSGWVWLIVDNLGKLQITSTQNQDNPLMSNATVKGTPILALDVWEHAYYLNYQQKKKNYIDAFFNIINWKKVNEKYEEAIKK